MIMMMIIINPPNTVIIIDVKIILTVIIVIVAITIQIWMFQYWRLIAKLYSNHPTSSSSSNTPLILSVPKSDNIEEAKVNGINVKAGGFYDPCHRPEIRTVFVMIIGQFVSCYVHCGSSSIDRAAVVIWCYNNNTVTWAEWKCQKIVAGSVFIPAHCGVKILS